MGDAIVEIKGSHLVLEKASCTIYFRCRFSLISYIFNGLVPKTVIGFIF